MNRGKGENGVALSRPARTWVGTTLVGSPTPTNPQPSSPAGRWVSCIDLHMHTVRVFRAQM
ncbi:hypothetical protein MGG_16227 [Pyricularia oryzae 70-15]|uniref:Uncharacterized protein n=1 Tax=Pyricularia oryzae (strain 70-15 / ATCC MYA-4617 / FGSC 8958) TaxID=242507 RepID=G4MNU7_PYRO7|nr:uncharacterized protein MGG_16227 [Pyricularia oryzae 70-15]EHA57104.1 hypothetical protein MGG_16227 [Pyricularia oryzae 70-15]